MRFLRTQFFILLACLLVFSCNTGGPDDDPKRGIVGVLEVEVTDYADHSDTTTALVTEANERILLKFEHAPGLTSGTRIEARGTWAAPEIGYAGVLQVKAYTTVAEARDVGRRTQALSAFQSRRVAVLILENGNTTPALARDLIAEVDRYFRENSSGAVGFEGNVFGIYPVSDAAYGTGLGAIRDEALAAWEGEGNRQADFDHIAFVQDPAKYPEKYRWAGVAGVNAPLSSYRSFDMRVFTHELGHNLGMLHSGSIHCPEAIYSTDPESCSTSEYGHRFDPMGGRFNGHFSPAQKQRMGWLEQCQDVTTGGNGVFRLAPLEGECGIRSLRVPMPIQGEHFLPGVQQFYYIGYRESGSGEYGGVTRQDDGVLVTVAEDALKHATTPALLDFTQSTSNEFLDAWLPVGTWFTLPHGVQVKVRSQNDSGAVVEVRTEGTGSPRCVDNTVAPMDSSGHYHGNIGNTCGDGSDLCPDDPRKSVPGTCGCGNLDGDTDGDGAADCIDPCPSDPSKVDPGICGCGTPDDGNEDGLFDCVTYDTCTGAEDPDIDGDGAFNCSKFLDATGVSGSSGQERHFTIDVPAGSSRFAVTLIPDRFGGDPDLYMRRGSRPNIRDGVFDCRPYLAGPNREVCLLINPEPGTYHLTVYGYGNFSNARLLANYSGNPPDECPSDPAKVAPGACGCGSPEQSGCDGDGGSMDGANGLVVVEAEAFTSRRGRGGSFWQPVSNGGMSGGDGMRAWPNDGNRISKNYSSLSPQLNYGIHFSDAGRYYVWVRSSGPTGSDDSLHVGLDDQAQPGGHSVHGTQGGFGWTSSLMGGGRAFIDVESAGLHVLNVWMREDGLSLDKLILTQDPSFTPELSSVRMEWKALGKWAQGRWQLDEQHASDGVCGGAQATNVRGASTSNTGGWTKWEFIDAGGEWYFIKNRQSGKYLQATHYAAGIAGDTVVRLVDDTCTGDWTRWKLVPGEAAGYYRLENRQFGTWLRGNPDVDPETGSEHYLTVTPTSNRGDRTHWRFIATP